MEKRQIATAAMAILFLALSTTVVIAKHDDEGSDEGSDEVLYYVSLGNSLSQGVQPDENGVNELTDDGYADQLYQALAVDLPELRLVKLGCPLQETSTGMIAGADQSFCVYPEGSQLNEAVAFLKAHRRSVVLITIDIGANDSLPCGLTDSQCLINSFATVRFNLETTILPSLREAAGPDVPIVGMNYYNPFLVAWINPGGPFGQQLAIGSTMLTQIFAEEFLAPAYANFGAPTADVFSAFITSDFTPGSSGLPVNVETLCTLTWMCDPAVGPNIHARPSGYAVIAETFMEHIDLDDEDDDEDDD